MVRMSLFYKCFDQYQVSYSCLHNQEYYKQQCLDDGCYNE